MINRLFLSLFAVALFVPFARAATYTAASCSQAAVQAAINAEIASAADGDIIAIPAGTCSWTGTTAVSGSFSKSVTIQGAGAVSTTTGGASTTGTDQTLIFDDLDHSTQLSTIIIGTSAGKSFRMTGLAIKQNASSTGDNGIVFISGSSTSIRVDHCHFYLDMAGYDIFFSGSVLGVVDHVYFEGADGWGGISFNLNGASTLGHESWNQTDQWGSSYFFYVEDCQVNGSSLGDAHDGARYVWRHNTIISSDSTGPQMYNHGVVTDSGRGTRAAEMYLNNIVESYPPGINQPTESPNSGTLLYWGNTINGYTSAVQIGYTCRTDSTSCNYNYPVPPTGWGHCGTLQGPSNWDGNNDSSGYPCIDQPGRGRGDLLTGFFPTLCDQTLGCTTNNGQWPREDISPIYVWGNSYTPASGYGFASLVSINGTAFPIVADNRDYYQQFGTNAEAGSFNGTKGVGQGLLSARPSTCTAGPGGNTPGVGYWATDQSKLYVCTATNTWSAYYTPYTYPHPLTSGVLPPTNLRAVVH